MASAPAMLGHTNILSRRRPLGRTQAGGAFSDRDIAFGFLAISSIAPDLGLVAGSMQRAYSPEGLSIHDGPRCI